MSKSKPSKPSTPKDPLAGIPMTGSNNYAAQEIAINNMSEADRHRLYVQGGALDGGKGRGKK